MNSQPDSETRTLAASNNFTPTASTLVLILAGCLFSLILLLFLFQNILQGKFHQSTNGTQADKIDARVVTTRTQPSAPKTSLGRIFLATDRSNSKKHLKQIGLAMYNYHGTHRVLPPGRTETKSGHPYHSWQTYLLPYLYRGDIYYQLDFKKPWDDPRNYKVFQQEVPEYLNPVIKEKLAPDGTALSHYVGNILVLKENESLPFNQITDGMDNTIFAIGRGNNFHNWGDPTSLADPQTLIGPDRVSAFPDGTQALMSSGAVRFISKNIDPAILKALSTPDSNDSIGDF
jgi:hypothetical protein